MITEKKNHTHTQQPTLHMHWPKNEAIALDRCTPHNPYFPQEIKERQQQQQTRFTLVVCLVMP